MAPQAFNRDLALQMTLHTHGITAVRREPGRIHDRACGSRHLCTGDVRRAWAMTALAADAGVQECGLRVKVVCPFDRRPHAADMAAQTTRESRETQGNFTGVLVARCH